MKRTLMRLDRVSHKHLIGLCKAILICTLRLAREGAISEGHQPQQHRHREASQGQLSGQDVQIHCPTCSPPPSLSCFVYGRGVVSALVDRMSRSDVAMPVQEQTLATKGQAWNLVAMAASWGMGHTQALQAVPERNIEVCRQAAHDRLAVRPNAARQHSHLSRVKELHRLPYEGPEEL